jgi:hypothetical protein
LDNFIVWQGRRYSVVQIERRWQSPEGPAFCVGTETGERFQLHYHEVAHRWAIDPLATGDHTPRPPIIEKMHNHNENREVLS